MNTIKLTEQLGANDALESLAKAVRALPGGAAALDQAIVDVSTIGGNNA